ncbi:hypothetical protein KTAU_03590 [Thermogemmatispora aurantia]|uniref:Uncharacterized protein n=1 Tax=Thermogemmatispora aurantia TaxID=2045279 RepID=A0A5J4K4M2_9CHLR|nr:hypothetical protein KTAU_03590 [Thermogemmatispora aurantia]
MHPDCCKAGSKQDSCSGFAVVCVCVTSIATFHSIETQKTKKKKESTACKIRKVVVVVSHP